MSEAGFELDVTQDDAQAFARISGDWNPLHTDADYAAHTAYRRPVLHGAFSAGLISRLAGMYLPGSNCLLHSMRLNFVTPIVLPARLVVTGRDVGAAGNGRVEAVIGDRSSGIRYVDAVYEYGLHGQQGHVTREVAATDVPRSDAPILVVGGSGGIGGALLRKLGRRGQGVSRRLVPGMIQADDAWSIDAKLGVRRISAIVQCGWPRPDNQDLLSLPTAREAIDHHLAAPLRQVLALGRLLRDRGQPGAMLILIGSTFAEPGRHGYRMPLYSLAKSLVPTLSRILAIELAPSRMRCAAVVFDVLSGGMNEGLGAATLQAHADRMPAGILPTADDAAAQIAWLLDNPSMLASGATLTLSGGALP